MKTPTPIAPNSTSSRPLRPPRRLLLLTALALVCGGSTLGPVRSDHAAPEPRAHTELGAAQNDTAHQLTAKLSSLNGIVRVGVGLFLCGLLSLCYPPVRALIRGVNARVALLVGGVVLMVLPTLIVGNEPLILGAVALIGGGWYLACSRSGKSARREKRVHCPHGVSGSGSGV